jgi:tetratricopeptide (TPR) repeat protein
MFKKLVGGQPAPVEAAPPDTKQVVQQAVSEIVEETRANLRQAVKEIVTEEKAVQDQSAQQAAEALQESKQAIQQAIKKVVDEMVEETQTNVKAAVEQAQKAAVEQKKAEDEAQKVKTVVEAPVAPPKVRPEIRPHAFVVMPFGKKKGGDGSLYDFNAIYTQLLKPTLESAGFESFRADEATTSGDILTDMFQELLLADLVLCDMSIDNANVFYELGIRHAFQKRGVVHIQAGRSYMPFDIFNVRTIPYHVTPEGVPDPAFIEKDKAGIARVCMDTWKSDRDAVHSPIFNLLTGLIEPDRKTLRTPLATGFWREYNEWKQRVTIAQRRHRIGDILLLTEEISNPLIKEEALGEAGKALQNMGRNELALQQYQKGLEINSRNLNFRRQEAIFLNRLGRVEEAIVKLENILDDFPSDTEAIGTLGRIYKDMWSDSWKWIKDKEKRMRTAFESYHWLVKAFNTYLKGYRFDLDNTYPGVNALTLGTILVDLADRYDDKEDPDPDIIEIRKLLPELRGTLLFALDSQSVNEKIDYWTLVSLAELHVMTSDRTQRVVRAYRKALTAARRNLFFLQSSLAQLEILESLDMREEYVKAGMRAIHDEIHRLRKEEFDEVDEKKAQHQKIEGNVFVFVGYMISNARKKGNHFPPEKEPEIRNAIRKVLDKYNAGSNDLAFTTGMDAGSEIIFVELCVERGIAVQAYFPVPEAPYVRDFVSPGGDQWIERFYRMRNHPLCDEFYQPDNVGAVKEGDSLHERNNRWTLYSALLRGIDKLRLIALWDGKTETTSDLDAQLVKHMVDLMRDMGGQVEHINSLKLSAEESALPAPEIAPAEKAPEKAPKPHKGSS